MRISLPRLVVAIIASVPVVHAGAISLYSNFGPAMAYNTGVSSGLGASRGLAMEFTPSVTGRFSDAQFALELVGSGQLSVLLDSDNSDAPGAILETLTLPGSTFGVLTVDSVLHPLLTAGTPYWLVLSFSGTGPGSGWFWDSTGDDPTGTDEATAPDATGPWTEVQPGTLPGFPPTARGAFEIDGTAVPEPSAALLIASSFVALLAAKRRVR